MSCTGDAGDVSDIGDFMMDGRVEDVDAVSLEVRRDEKDLVNVSMMYGGLSRGGYLPATWY